MSGETEEPHKKIPLPAALASEASSQRGILYDGRAGHSP
jgi:hypothetical protein